MGLPAPACSGPPHGRVRGVFRLERGPGQRAPVPTPVPTPTGPPAQHCWFSEQAPRGPHGPTKCPALWFLERAHHGPWSCPALLVLGAGPPWTPRSHQVPSAAGSRLACQALLVFILPALPGSQHTHQRRGPGAHRRTRTMPRAAVTCIALSGDGGCCGVCFRGLVTRQTDAGPACSCGPADVTTEDCRSSGNITCSRSHLGFGH